MNTLRQPRNRRVLFLILWLGFFSTHYLYADNQQQTAQLKSDQFALKLASGDIPNESDLRALKEALVEIRWPEGKEGKTQERVFWESVGRQIGQTLAEGLSVIAENPDHTFRSNRYSRLIHLLRRIRFAFLEHRQLSGFHEIAISAKKQLNEKNAEPTQRFLQVLKDVPIGTAERRLTYDDRATALNGLLTTLQRAHLEAVDEIRRNQNSSPPQKNSPNPMTTPGNGVKTPEEPGAPAMPSEVEPSSLAKLLKTIFMVLLVIVGPLLGMVLVSHRTRRGSFRTPFFSKRRDSDNPRSVKDSEPPVSREEMIWRETATDRIRKTETHLAYVKAKLASLQEEVASRIQQTPPVNVQPTFAPVSGDDLQRIEQDLGSLRHELEDLRSTPQQEPPPDLRPQLGQTNSSLRKAISELRKLKEQQFDLIEIELGALAKLWQKAEEYIGAMPLVGPLASDNFEVIARINVIRSELPNKLDGRLAESAKTVVQPILDASQIASKLKATRKLLENRSSSEIPLQTSESISLTLFKIREFSFQLRKLLNTDEGRKWQEVKLDGWIRVSFRNLADQIYREHWHRKLDGKGDSLSEACEAVDEILSWGDLAVIPLEPGTAFDSQKQLGTSTASRADYPDGAIVGVVRVGFRDVTTEQIIQKPEVVVNRR